MNLRHVFKNTAWLTVSYGFGRVLTAIWQIYLIRYYSSHPDLYAEYIYLLANYAIWLTIADGSLFSAHQQINSEKAQPEKIQIKRLLKIRINLGAISALGFIVCVIGQGSEPSVPLFLLSLQILLFAVGTVPLLYFGINGSFKIESISAVIGTLFFIAPAIICLQYTSDIVVLTTCSIFGTLVSTVYVWTKVKDFNLILQAVYLSDARVEYKKYLRLMLPLTLASFAFILNFRIDIIYIFNSISKIDSGIYSIAVLLYFLILDLSWGQFSKAYSISAYNKWSEVMHRGHYSNVMEGVFISFNLLIFCILFLLSFLIGPLLKFIVGNDSIWLQSIPSLVLLSQGLQSSIGLSIALKLSTIEGVLIRSVVILLINIAAKYLVLNFFEIKEFDKVALINVVFSVVAYIFVSINLSKNAREIFLRPASLFTVIFPMLSTVFILGAPLNTNIHEITLEYLFLFCAIVTFIWKRNMILKTFIRARSNL